MKKAPVLLMIAAFAAVLLLSACTRSQTTPETPPTATATEGLPLLDAVATQTAAANLEAIAPLVTATPSPVPPTESAPSAPEAEPTSTAEPPTPTDEPPAALTLVPKDQKTATPTLPPTPQGEAFDPTGTYGAPTFMDPMNSGSYGNWKSNDKLPNTELLQISLEGDNMYVTGKKPGFSTWYFSWPTLTDFYMQMEVKTGECSGKDEYGLIVRGPAHGAGVSYGYIVAFTCDGYYRLTRLDSADPYSVTDLVSSTKSSAITTGADQKNVIAIRAVGKKLTIFANGYQLAEISDATFPKGRYGLFVRGVETINYTYHPVQIVYWDLSE